MEQRKWWQDGVVYQIYPRSFCDSNGDGYGDIPGIISKLDKLQDLGIDAIWLSPVYKSPQVDNGYDIADYKAIDPMFGTMEDFDNLLAEAKARGIRIIMDLVINHTSDQHEWFQKSRRREKGYEDYYIWSDKPNNWGGFFGGGAWDFDEVRGQYYLHLFAKEQPDLNWRNPKIMEEVQEILRFWLDKGVAGFRCDVINIIWKNDLENGVPSPILAGLKHYHSTPGCHAILRRLRRDVLDKYDAYTVGETVFVNEQQGRELCEPHRKELDEIFSFEHMETEQIGVKWFKHSFKPEKFFRSIAKWQHALTWNANYFENHDQPRSVSRFGDDGEYHNKSAKMLATMLLTLKGTPYIYEGQEIGMTNFDFTSMDELQDVESHNIYGIAKKLPLSEAYRWKMIKTSSRDNARQGVQWDSSPNGGFTSGTPWLAVNRNYETINYAAQELDPDSILNYYKAMLRFRRENEVLRRGGFNERLIKGNVFVYEREYEGKKLTVLLNFSAKAEKVPFKGRQAFGNYEKKEFVGILAPWEGAIIEEG